MKKNQALVSKSPTVWDIIQNRSAQLNDWARAKISGKDVVITQYSTFNIEGCVGEEEPLYEYQTPDGTYLEQFGRGLGRLCLVLDGQIVQESF